MEVGSGMPTNLEQPVQDGGPIAENHSQEHPPGSGGLVDGWQPCAAPQQPLHFITKGSPIAAAGALIHVIIITILRNVQRAIDTRDHMAEVSRVSKESLSIVLSEDGAVTGNPGKIALLQLLPKLPAAKPKR